MSASIDVPALACPDCKSRNVQCDMDATVCFRDDGNGGATWNIPSGYAAPAAHAECHDCGHDGTCESFTS